MSTKKRSNLSKPPKNNQKLRALLDKFKELSEQRFSIKREESIDDVFAALMKIKFESGKKNYADENHPKTRTRSFTYSCTDKKHHLLVKVVMVKGESGKTRFIVEEKF